MKILIPTCKRPHELAGMVAAIHATTNDSDVIVSGLPASASVNRNYCLSLIEQHDRDGVPIETITIMLDDDIEGFYEGWTWDLTEPLVKDDSVVMVSARLLNPDGSFGPTCSRCYEAEPEEIEIKSNGVCVIPTAAIAFRYRGFKFDEHFIGSGFEDNDWCFQYLAADPSAKFLQSNRCRLVHRNEMKNQKGSNWKHNMAYFFTKWRPQYATR